MVFQNEWDDYNLHYSLNQSSYNKEISWYMQRNTSLLQALSGEAEVRKADFCENFIAQLEEDETLYLNFSDEATFHLCGIVNKQTNKQTECTYLRK